MIKKTLVLTVLLLAGSAALAPAADEPTSFAFARLGSLQVISSVMLSASSADMRGVWLDTRVRCVVSRKLRVHAEISLSPLVGEGASKRYVRAGAFPDPNCAEGGPNVGFTISARKANFACPNGRWKPGIYSFDTTTTEPKKKLKASASLGWTNRVNC
jgi:hypothetical protein